MVGTTRRSLSTEASRLPGPLRIAVADSQPLYREALRRLIGSEPGLLWVGETGDGREVLPLLGAVKPDVILLQVPMPKVDGTALFQDLQSTGTRVILIVDADEPRKLGMALERNASAQVARGS